MNRFAPLLACFFVGLSLPALAQDDGGDTFEDATFLPFGQLSVTEPLLSDFAGPDLYLGVLDGSDAVFDDDDDSSIYGDGLAPGLNSVPVNPGGEIAFQITGFGDTDFTGDHVEFGEFEVYLDIFDAGGGFVDGRRLNGFIDGFVAEEAVAIFSESDPSWDGAFYDINVNNAFPNDVDFFLFSGLTPGEAFTAETRETPDSFLDTVLGFFDGAGNLIASDDDSGEFNYSKLSGLVPSNGEIVLAVSGFGDIDFFEGFHPFMGEYELVVTQNSVLTGDYDGDGDIDADDRTAWADAYGATGAGLAADGNGDGFVDAADYTVWRDAFASQPAAVPEPGGLAGLLLGLAGASRWRRRQA